MKRSRQEKDADAPAPEEEKAEMNVDDDEKATTTDNAQVDTSQVPFLDTFYGLSSLDPQERAQAGRAMLFHCLLGPDANIQDASYAFKRLIQALCSGRAAARQGNASALTSFLRLAVEHDILKEIQKETRSEETLVSDLNFVRQRVLQVTEPGQGKRKGSEERDYKFGRLFGILAVVKSGILLSRDSATQEVVDVTKGFAGDLIELYHYKKWMREPAAHALCMLLNSLYAADNAVQVLDTVVNDVIVPLFLAPNGDTSGSHVLATWSAEQLAVAMHLQSHTECHAHGLPPPLDQTVLSKDTLPVMAQALSETSAVTQPRTHLVWDVIWNYLTEKTFTTNSVDTRKPKTLVSGESVQEVVGSILQTVILERLLGMEDAAKPGKITHQRRALALCILRSLLGVEFVSSLSGRTRLCMDPHMVDTIVLDPILVQKLFLDNISGHQQSILKPLAVQILDSVVTGIDDNEMRLAVVRALLRCEPRFDSKTKLTTIQALLDTNDASFLEGYLSFLQAQVLRVEDGSDDLISPYQAIGYVDLIFYLGKAAITREKDESNAVPSLAQKILDFFLVSAFFDCRTFKERQKNKGEDSILEIAAMMHSSRTTALPYQVRTIASARFFSLVSELVAAISHLSGHDKDPMILNILTSVRKNCHTVQNAGAKRFDDEVGDDMETDEEKSPLEVVEALCKHADIDTEEPQEGLKAERRLTVGFAILSEAVFLHLLTCGQPDNMMKEDDPDADDDEDKEEVHSLLSDLYEIFEDFSKENDDDKMTNDVLLGLAELCTNVLSSPLSTGNQRRGASPRLLRESVKIVWTRVLSLAAQDHLELGPDVISVLLQSIGAIAGSEEDESDESSEGESGESMDESDDDHGVSAKAAQAHSVEEPDEGSSSGSMDRNEEGSDDDIVLDPAKLQTMLEEDIDDASIEADELEHHEGADAALAKIIQLKQEARKAGQKARERLELTRQLRCTLLLDILASGKPEGWGALLRINTLLEIIVEMLRYRSELEKALAKASERGTDVTLGEKKAILDRITAIVKTKLLKFRVSSLKWSKDVDAGSFTEGMASSLFTELRQTNSKDQQHLCINAILLLIRTVDKEEDQLRIADMFGNAVEEWASKRTTRFDTTFFDHLIHQAPSIAQASLPHALASAASTARSSFLKSEAFRLLAQLYNPKLASNDTEMANVARIKISDAFSEVLQSIALALKDDEMKKTKRVKEVLKAAEKVTAFLGTTSDSSDLELLDEVKELVVAVRDGTDSQGVRNSCDKLIQELAGVATPATDQQKSQEDDADACEQSQEVKSSKKKKKKSKKKKKR